MSEQEKIIGEASEPDKLEVGTYHATITGAKVKMLKFGELVEFSFKLLDIGDNIPFDTIKGGFAFKNRKIYGKLHKALEIISEKAIDLKLKEKHDIVAMTVGKNCLVKVENKEKDGRVYSNVVEILPPIKSKTQASTQQSSKPKDEEFTPPDKSAEKPKINTGTNEGFEF